MMLGECGARTRFRASTAMDLVAARAEPHAETRTRAEAPHENEPTTTTPPTTSERVGRRGATRARDFGTRRRPSQYAVWLWPTTENERRPLEDRLVDDDPSTLASSYAGFRSPRASARTRSPAVSGSDRSHPGVGRDASHRARRRGGGAPASREDAFMARATWDDEEDARLAAEAVKTRTLWESTADGDGNGRGRRCTRAWWPCATFWDGTRPRRRASRPNRPSPSPRRRNSPRRKPPPRSRRTNRRTRSCRKRRGQRRNAGSCTRRSCTWAFEGEGEVGKKFPKNLPRRFRLRFRTPRRLRTPGSSRESVSRTTRRGSRDERRPTFCARRWTSWRAR